MSLRFVPSVTVTPEVGRDVPRCFRLPLPSPPLSHRVRTVLFDFGDVLCDNTAWRRWLLRLLQQLGLQTQYRVFFRVWDRDYLIAVHSGQQTFRDALESFLLSVGLTRGQIEEVIAACMARRHDLEDSLRPLPGVRTTLSKLIESGWTLGILCNSEFSADRLRTQLTRLGMDGWFRAIISSFDLQCVMPNPQCYYTALEGLKMPASETAFVGHDAAELAGAASVGMATIAFNFDPDAQADGYLSRFEDLLNVLGSPQLPLAAAG